MKQPFKYILTALLVFLTGVSLLHLLIFHGLNNSEADTKKKMDLLFNNKDKFDILLVGSSRTLYGADTRLIETLTSKKIMNAGVEGADIQEMQLVLEGYLSSHPDPEKVVIMADLHSFAKNENPPFNRISYSQYLFNSGVYTSMRKEMGIRIDFWKYLPFTTLTEFDDHLRSLALRGLMVKNEGKSWHGYIPLDHTFTETKNENFAGLHLPDNTELRILLDMIDICRKKKTDVVITPGAYYSGCMNTAIHTFYENLEKALPGGLIFDDIITYDSTSYFKDATHLNSHGASVYARHLSDLINHGR